MRKPTYGEHLYNYLYSLDYEGLNFDEAEAREWASEADALLRVARAAKENIRVHKVVDGTTIGTVFDMKFATRELEEALKEVEHLLD